MIQYFFSYDKYSLYLICIIVNCYSCNLKKVNNEYQFQEPKNNSTDSIENIIIDNQNLNLVDDTLVYEILSLNHQKIRTQLELGKINDYFGKIDSVKTIYNEIDERNDTYLFVDENLVVLHKNQIVQFEVNNNNLRITNEKRLKIGDNINALKKFSHEFFKNRDALLIHLYSNKYKVFVDSAIYIEFDDKELITQIKLIDF